MKKKLDIIYEDKELLVVNKESKQLCVGTEKDHLRTLYHEASTYVKKQYPKNKVFIVNRLDKDTSGIVVFAKNESVKKELQENWNDIATREYLAIVEGKVNKKEEIKELPKTSKETKIDNDIIVGDTKNIKTRIANCCLPLPGDNIIGYITKTNGISIHRNTCPNVVDDERIIASHWNETIKNKYYSEIIIYTNSKENIVVDIVQAVSSLKLAIEHINLINKSDTSIYTINLQVTNKEELENVIKQLEKIKYVTKVERMIE